MSSGSQDFLKRHRDVLDLLLVEDQLRVDDNSLTAQLPERRSNRNRVIYNPSSKASLPGRLSNRNRTVFMTDSRFI